MLLTQTSSSILSALSNMVDCGDHGRAVIVLNHPDLNKVWILSFDLNRFYFYRRLGIQVDNYHEYPFTYFKVYSDGRRWQEWSGFCIFECEYLTLGEYSVKDAYARYTSVISEWDHTFMLPQPSEDLQTWVTACLEVGYTDDNYASDFSLWNTLWRGDKMFMTDLIEREDCSNVAPYVDEDYNEQYILFAPSQFAEAFRQMTGKRVNPFVESYILEEA